ncbi:uncharacterized protein LOC144345248, partial [Saccoglossus kowalevskii]
MGGDYRHGGCGYLLGIECVFVVIVLLTATALSITTEDYATDYTDVTIESEYTGTTARTTFSPTQTVENTQGFSTENTFTASTTTFGDNLSSQSETNVLSTIETIKNIPSDTSGSTDEFTNNTPGLTGASTSADKTTADKTTADKTTADENTIDGTTVDDTALYTAISVSHETQTSDVPEVTTDWYYHDRTSLQGITMIGHLYRVLPRQDISTRYYHDRTSLQGIAMTGHLYRVDESLSASSIGSIYICNAVTGF